MTTVYELAKLVDRMRAAQRAFFKTKNSNTLRIARDYERRVDASTKQVIRDAELTPSLPGMQEDES